MKRGRPPGGGNGDRGANPGARQPPPPDATGIEADYLEALRATGRSVVVRLRDGRSFEGPIIAVDRTTLELGAEGSSSVLVRKADVAWIAEAEGEGEPEQGAS